MIYETDPSCEYPYKPLWNVGIDCIEKDYPRLDAAPVGAETIRVTTQSFADYVKNYAKINILGFRVVETNEIVIKKRWECEDDIKFVQFVVDFFVPIGNRYRTYGPTEVELTNSHKDFIASLSML